MALGKSGQAPGSGNQAPARGHPQVTTSPGHCSCAAAVRVSPQQSAQGQDTEQTPELSPGPPAPLLSAGEEQEGICHP